MGNANQQGRGGETAASVLHLCVVCQCLLLLLALPVRAQSPALTEAQIKAGFLFNFTKFVEWPPDAFPNPSSPIVLGIVGEDRFGSLLSQAVAGKTINGRPVLLRRFNDGENLHDCNILFVSASEEKRVADILATLRGSSVLTVGESNDFARLGGIINFLVEDNKVRLQINLQAAARARVRISAKVIAVARLVTDSSTAGKG